MGKKNPDKMTSDDHYHARVNRFVELAILLINMIVGYEIESSGKQRQWNGMIKSATEAIELLKNREFAVKPLNSFCANKVDESPTNVVSPNENGAWRKEKEDLQSYQKELLQKNAILDQEGSSISEAKSKIMAHKNFLKKTDDSILEITGKSNLNQDCGHHAVDTGGEQLLEFPQTPINQKGKNVEVGDREGSQNSADDIFAEILEDIPLLECRGHLESLFKKNMTGKSARRDEGTSNARANEANAKQSADETCIFLSNKNNANLLAEIFEKYPNIIDNLQVSSQKLLDYLMNELAQVHQKIIKSNPEMLKLDGIIDMEKMVRDMEHNGLQVTWLREKLEESRERLENQETKNKLLERINNCKAETEETEQEQAQSTKKRRHK